MNSSISSFSEPASGARPNGWVGAVLVSWISGIAMLAACITQVGYLGADSPIRAARWLYPVFLRQDAELEKPGDQARLILLGGSNVLFGFDGALLQKYSGMDVVNLGAHADFSISHQITRLKGKLRPGDLVVASFEHPKYAQPEHLEFEQIQTLVWIQRYYKQVSFLRNITNIVEARTELIGEVIARRVLQSDRIPVFLNQIDENKRAEGCTHSLSPVEQYYDESRLDDHCFVYVSEPLSGRGLEAARDNKSPYQPPVLSLEAISSFARLDEIALTAGAHVIYTWPAMMDIPHHPRGDMALQETYQNHAIAMRDAGFRFVCEAEDHWLPPAHFLDTEYHLNGWGASRRSLNLAQCLTREGLLPTGQVATIGAETLDTGDLSLLLASRRERLAKPFPFESDVAALLSFQAAILEDRNLLTRAETWTELPEAARPDMVPAARRVTYRSPAAGTFKILVEASELCAYAKDFALPLIDSKRGCPYLAIASPNAQDW